MCNCAVENTGDLLHSSWWLLPPTRFIFSSTVVSTIAGLLVLIFSPSRLSSLNGWCCSASLCNVGGCLRFGLGDPKGPEKKTTDFFVMFTTERDAFHVEELVNVHARQTERLPGLHFFSSFKANI